MYDANVFIYRNTNLAQSSNSVANDTYQPILVSQPNVGNWNAWKINTFALSYAYYLVLRRHMLRKQPWDVSTVFACRFRFVWIAIQSCKDGIIRTKFVLYWHLYSFISKTRPSKFSRHPVACFNQQRPLWVLFPLVEYRIVAIGRIYEARMHLPMTAAPLRPWRYDADVLFLFGFSNVWRIRATEITYKVSYTHGPYHPSPIKAFSAESVVTTR